MVKPPESSVPTGMGYETCAVQVPGDVFATISFGQLMTGAVFDTTVTVKSHEAMLPVASVACQVTVVEPSGKELPDPGPRIRLSVTPEQLSTAAGDV